MYRSHVLVCGGTGCTSSGSQQIQDLLKAEIEKAVTERYLSQFPQYRQTFRVYFCKSDDGARFVED